MRGKRSNIEIIADILRLGKASKTDILYGCDLSYTQLQKYLHFLIARGLLELGEDDSEGRRYESTALGNELLGRIDWVRELMGLSDHYAYDSEDEGNTAVVGGLHRRQQFRSQKTEGG